MNYILRLSKQILKFTTYLFKKHRYEESILTAVRPRMFICKPLKNLYQHRGIQWPKCGNHWWKPRGTTWSPPELNRKVFMSRYSQPHHARPRAPHPNLHIQGSQGSFVYNHQSTEINPRTQSLDHFSHWSSLFLNFLHLRLLTLVEKLLLRSQLKQQEHKN